MPRLFMWDLWWANSHWDSFLSEYLGLHDSIIKPVLTRKRRSIILAPESVVKQHTPLQLCLKYPRSTTYKVTT